ncbi:MAG: glycosyltransferase [Chitinophagales bacterium]|nr:glycosyltransferase [Chitinophagaceae bacterium]MCB9065394.1 glycosyltransferase [Chitinophagales bacterium]
MSGDIQKRTLLVVSDTAMYNDGGEVLVFDPVLRELMVIEDMFDNIIWLGARTLRKKGSLKPIASDKIKAEMMPCVSRSGWINIFFVILAYPVFLVRILKHLKRATHVHTRAPSHPAMLMILLSYLDNKRIYAHKYAGEWTDRNIPFTYRSQRSLLKRARKRNLKVVISGKNEEESVNVHDMENPCIYGYEIDAMNNAGLAKKFDGKLRLLFVGNLMPTKGIMELLTAIQNQQLSDRYKELYIVGSGKLKSEVEHVVRDIKNIQVNMLGDLSREELNKQYAAAHMLILPSSSESFPKVIAEAAAYGCIPVTTSLSAITKKVKDGESGFLMTDNHPDNILSTLNKVAETTDLKSISNESIAMSRLFTYERFKERMKKIYEISE